MLFMVIEKFKDNNMLPVYKRVRDEGRGFPEGLKYLGSWIEPSFSRCFQQWNATICVFCKNGCFGSPAQALPSR